MKHLKNFENDNIESNVHYEFYMTKNDGTEHQFTLNKD